MANYRENEYNTDIAKRIFVDKLDECEYFPRYITMETCNNCDAKCIMCPKGQKGTSKLEVMDDVLYDKIVLELEQYRDWIEMICLNSDGEPTLDQKLAERIKKLKTIGIKRVNISTNGQLLNEKMAHDLISSGLDDIRISLDGYHKDTYEKIRKGLNYDTVMENVKKLIEIRDSYHSKMQIRLRMVEMPENKNERQEWIEYWENLVGEGDKIQLMPMHTWSGTVAPEREERIRFYEDKPCVSVFSSCTINYDGDVQLCDSDINQSVILGNIENSSIKSIWNKKEFVEIRQKHANAKRNEIPICRGCNHWSREFSNI